MKKVITICLILGTLFITIDANAQVVKDSECKRADGSPCRSCADVFRWKPNRCQLSPQPHGCCYPAKNPPPRS